MSIKTFLSVDVVAIDPALGVLLPPRLTNPHMGDNCLPGVVLRSDFGETVQDAGMRALRDKAHYPANNNTPFLVSHVVSDPGRDLRGHTVSIVCIAIINAYRGAAQFVDDTLFRGDKIPRGMPFSHYSMLTTAVTLARNRLMVDSDVTYTLLGDTTTVQDYYVLDQMLCQILHPDHDECQRHYISMAAAGKRLARSELYQKTQAIDSRRYFQWKRK